MKKILVPCDFSGPALEARKLAVDIAKKSGGEVLILKVIDLPMIVSSGFDIQPYSYDVTILKGFEEEARRKYEKIKLIRNNVKETFHVQRGNIYTTIRDFIDRKKIDLVIMGTHGTSGLGNFFYGSNTDKIVRLSSVPVIAVKKSVPISTIKTILLPSTLDLKQTRLMKNVKELQEFFGASLQVLWVNTLNKFLRTDEINPLMADFVKHYKLKKCTLHVQNDTLEQDGILRFAMDNKPDLIVMATHGRRGLAHLLSGSVAEDVVNHVTCPIWTLSTHK